MSKEQSIESLGNAMAWFVGLAAIPHIIDMLAAELEMLTVYDEIKEVAGEDFAEACLEDNECYRTMKEIAKESLKAEAETPEEEKKKYREKILNELKEKLKQMGIKFYCEEKDLGEFGTLYEDCFIEYKGYKFSITEELKS